MELDILVLCRVLAAHEVLEGDRNKKKAEQT